MPTPRIQLPPLEEILKEAPNHPSFMSLAEALGYIPSTFQKALNREGHRDEVEAVLSRPGRGEPKERPAVDDPDRIALQRAKEENRALKKENRQYAEKLASQRQFFEEIIDATRVEVEVPTFKVKKQGDGKPRNSVILPLYDMQFGQFVRPQDTPGSRGNFNEAIFDERLARWVAAACKIIKARAENYIIDELIFVPGGDQVEGDEIFAGQSWQLEFGPPAQVVKLTAKLEAALKEVIRFAKEQVGIPWIAVYCVPGNHGKVGGRKSGARPSDYSWDWLHFMWLADKLRAEPIDQFAIEPAGSLFFYCAGHEFQAIHGDEIRGWGGIPFYGLTRFDGRSMRLHNRLYRYLLMGHHHQRAEIPNGAGETIVSGDWVGANNLSGAMTAASRPQQLILFVSQKWGIDGAERIYFAEADEAYVPTPIHGQAAA